MSTDLDDRGESVVSKNYPVNADDVWSLAKGDYISASACERLVGLGRNDRAYRLGLLDLRAKLERLWYETRGEVITTTTEKDGIRVHTDDDAIDVNGGALDVARRKVGRAVHRVGGIDATNVPIERRDDLVRLGIRAAAMFSGARRAVRYALKAYSRQTPALLPGCKDANG